MLAPYQGMRIVWQRHAGQVVVTQKRIWACRRGQEILRRRLAPISEQPLGHIWASNAAENRLTEIVIPLRPDQVGDPTFERLQKMRPEHDARRKIIREWMSLARDKRKTEDQAAAFARQASEKHEFMCSGDHYERVMAWLLPRTAKP
jgi:hypothetical protein